MNRTQKTTRLLPLLLALALLLWAAPVSAAEATPETAAKDYLDPDAVANPIYYPDQDVLDRTGVFVNLPSETSNLLDTLWAEVKMGGPGQSAVLIAIILVFLAVYIAIIIWKKQKRKRETGG